ncbi:MAG: alpha-galactosidase [Alphaproteobacteria bacterium]|nr:alpha-galactosidase [Alphaproteobacteria bacterium]
MAVNHKLPPEKSLTPETKYPLGKKEKFLTDKEQISPFNFVYQDVIISFNGKLLSLENGKFCREWLLQNGWNTCFLGRSRTGKNLAFPTALHPDWNITACEGYCRLTSIDCSICKWEMYKENQKFVRIHSFFYYPESDLYLQHEVDCYPMISGVRIQISLKSRKEIPQVKSSPEKQNLPGFVDGYTESVPVNPEDYRRLGFGLNCDSQHRYTFDTPILSEIRADATPVRSRELIANCNGLMLFNKAEEGFLLLKESHKCANNSGIATGDFLLHTHDVCSTGLGFSDLNPHWLSGKDYHSAWANWCIPFSGGENGARKALKEFDRARYPFYAERDMFIAMNTWGSRGAGEFSRSAAEEQNVLEELGSCADLGIDLLQVDDGWQFDPGTNDFETCNWEPSPIRFPHGWKYIRERADKLGIKLGIWVPPVLASDKKIIELIRSAGFRRVKLDFINITRREDLDRLIHTATLITGSIEKPVGINWDITEAFTRLGFYFGREYGNLFLQNCENSPPGFSNKRFIGYDPEVSLYQIWLLGKYFNLNQVQITIQRITDSPRGKGYPQDYACGIAFMGNPLFFMETKRFTQPERNLVREVLDVYKKHRDKILSGYVFPIGEEPTGNSWSGFQCIYSEKEGYLTVFREKNAISNYTNFLLQVPEGKTLQITGLYNANDQELAPCDSKTYRIEGISRASWAFFHYRIIGKRNG